jgi:hypothetical protein
MNANFGHRSPMYCCRVDLLGFNEVDRRGSASTLCGIIMYSSKRKVEGFDSVRVFSIMMLRPGVLWLYDCDTTSARIREMLQLADREI